MLLYILAAISFASPNLKDQLNEKRSQSQQKMPKEIGKTIKSATTSLKKSGIIENAIKTNARVPNFSFEYEGKQQNISDYYQKGTIVIHFYRGGWCPYCMLEMKAYEEQKNAFKRAGVKVLHFTPDTNSEILKTRKKHKLSGMVVSDVDNKIADQLGIAFKLDKKVQKIYKDFQIDLEKSQGNKNFALPIPAVYVVDKSGMIRYTFLDADYTNRAEPRDVLNEAKKW